MKTRAELFCVLSLLEGQDITLQKKVQVWSQMDLMLNPSCATLGDLNKLSKFGFLPV